MKKFYVLVSLLFFISSNFTYAQCDYISSDSSSTDDLSYVFSGGSFQSFGCAPIDPTYWLSGNSVSVTINFVVAEDYPSFRVWGMNTDDSASVTVNGADYSLNDNTASYNDKVVCGVSPGPDGVVFSGGLLFGANTNAEGNFSYQDVQLNTTNVTTMTISSESGAGWGFAGVLIDCPPTLNTVDFNSSDNGIKAYPNPVRDILYFSKRTDIKLYNVFGQEILKETDVDRINMSQLQSGTYIIAFTTETDKSTSYTRVIKE